MTSEPFTLTNAPAKPKPWKCPKPEPMRQTVLFAGLDCLPGQEDLFATDGQPEVAFQDSGEDTGEQK